MTPGQPTNFRLSADAIRELEELMEITRMRRTAVVETAIRQLHQRESKLKIKKNEGRSDLIL